MTNRCLTNISIVSHGMLLFYTGPVGLVAGAVVGAIVAMKPGDEKRKQEIEQKYEALIKRCIKEIDELIPYIKKCEKCLKDLKDFIHKVSYTS